MTTDASVRAAVLAGGWPRPWQWGQSDCCQFVRFCIRHIHGIDIMSAIPAYRTETEALILLYPSLADVVSRVFGDPAQSHAPARPALVRVPGADDDVLALTYSGGAICHSDTGLRRIPLGFVVCEWEV